jgi:hypothetical protein
MTASSGVGMPHALWLEQFGRVIYEAFGEWPYHVGSSMPGKGPGWRDVDVRLMLDDEAYEHMGFGDPARSHDNAKWCAFTLAFSELGKRMTGLPIDFQIQQTTHANKEFPAKDMHGRSALGLRSRMRHSPAISTDAPATGGKG